MSVIDTEGYVAVKHLSSARRSSFRGYNGSYRNFWVARQIINLGNVRVPKRFWGKRIRFQLQIVKDGDKMGLIIREK